MTMPLAESNLDNYLVWGLTTVSMKKQATKQACFRFKKSAIPVLKNIILPCTRGIKNRCKENVECELFSPAHTPSL